MASFSFGAGNTAKLVRIPLYVAGRLATFLIPRTHDTWVFGCGAGIGDGALALWKVAAADGADAVWLTGSAREAQDASDQGIRHVPKHSLRGFWLTARARVAVVTHGFGDVNRYAVSGAYLVQLWHGIPLKRIGLDSPATVRSGILPDSVLMRRILGLLYAGATRRIRLLPAASHLVRGRLESAFALGDHAVPVTGEPRVDVLAGTAAERRSSARSRLVRLVGPLPSPATRLALYAPTWRDGDPDPAVPSAADWRMLVDLLEEQDAVLLIRSHPLGAGDYSPPFATDRVRGLGSALLPDATPILPGLDVLVTDYSSMAFDAALVPLPVLYLAPDAAEYARHRGFYGRYADVAGSDAARTWAEASDRLRAVLTDGDERNAEIDRSRALSAHVHAFHDGENTRRVYGDILEEQGCRDDASRQKRGGPHDVGTFHDGWGALLLLEGDGARPSAVWLQGSRARVDATLTGRGKSWKARLPLEAARWGGPTLPLPAGEYDLGVRWSADGADERLTTDVVPVTMLDTLRAELQGGSGQLIVGPPVDPAYDSGEGQDALERRYVTQSAPLENAVFFESFYGRNASCNPLAIDHELARAAPGVRRYWSVVDLSVEVPPGAIAVVEALPNGGERGASRLLVVNDWLRRRFSRRPGQRVLQTWHGTPFKRLALHRPGFDPRRAAAVIKESRRWDVLLAQNSYSGRILKKAYAFLTRPIWVEGYPRNDALVTGDGAATRAALGIGADEMVILYAPTWRDDREQMVDFLDPAALAEATGAVVLVRGHSRTLLQGKDVAGSRVRDVTGFPDATRLLVIADALITDYSSIMFDFSVTGRPIFFLVPDMEHYRGELRGFYFDLEAHAPGPLVSSQAELIAAIADPETPARYASRYAVWRNKFNGRDDGRAGERVVARILDQGLVDRE